MTAELRESIVEHFSRDELMTFCADYFRDFYEDYEGSAITKTALARDLVEHCQRRRSTDILRANLQKIRPTSYVEKFGKVFVSPVSTKPRNPRQVFLSYSTHDLNFAQRLTADLRAEGVPVWAAFDSIQPGESWTSAIDRGLSESGVYIVALTPNSVSSQWVKAEVQFAFHQQQRGQGKLFPLVVQLCDVSQLSPLLTTIQHVDFAAGYNEGLTRTLQALGIQSAAERERQAAEAKARERAEAARREQETIARQQAEAERIRRERELQAERNRSAAEQRQDGGKKTALVATGQGHTSSRRALLIGAGGLALAGIGAGAITLVASSSGASRAIQPTAAPTAAPTTTPTAVPTAAPTTVPTAAPTATPTTAPTTAPISAAGVELVPGVTMQFVRVPEGEFLMGSDLTKDQKARSNEQPQHKVFLSAFDIGKYEVTNAQYDVFARDTQRAFSIPADKEDHPVVNVSWEDANAFAEWLSQKTGRKFNLPTEAQWEKAARGTNGRIYPWGNEFDKAKANASEGGPGTTTPVGTYSKAGDSPYGAADMSGNVWEWTADWYDESLYASRASDTEKDPTGPSSGQYRVLRGGSWGYSQDDARAASRSWVNPDGRGGFYGFRVVRAPVP